MREKVQRTMLGLVVLAGLAGGGGCQHYRVVDPTTGREYYTDQGGFKRYGHSGAVKFNDLATGREVTLQNSEMEKVSADEAKAGAARARSDAAER